VPIVASAAGGITEAVRDGVNGLVVPPGDVPALRAAILSLLGDEQRRRQMGRAGMALMEAEFSTDVMVDRHIALYREVLGGND
jgi:glycosyltransferase involved in cell wall biosynthesis